MVQRKHNEIIPGGFIVRSSLLLYARISIIDCDLRINCIKFIKLKGKSWKPTKAPGILSSIFNLDPPLISAKCLPFVYVRHLAVLI